jgi:hypothetical protein
MLSPSPTQPPPTWIESADQKQPVPETKKVALTPAKIRPGQTPAALFVKAIFRPIFKALYYIIRWIRSHKLVTFIAIILLLASIYVTSYAVTGSSPLQSSSDSLKKSIQDNPQMSPYVQNWLLALRSGDIQSMLAIEKTISPSTPPPNSAMYVLEFSEPHAQVKWTNVTVTSIKTASDGLIDTFVEVDMTQPTANGGGKTVTLWHFSTDPNGRIYLLDYVSARTS